MESTTGHFEYTIETQNLSPKCIWKRRNLRASRKLCFILRCWKGTTLVVSSEATLAVSFSPYGRPTLPIMMRCQNAKERQQRRPNSDLAWVLCLAFSQYSQEIFPHQHLAVVEEFDQLLNRSAGIGNCWDRNKRSLGWESGRHPGRCHCTAAGD